MNQSNKLQIVVSIDDVHPQSGWRILGDRTEFWLRQLNEQFGAKFTCFVPSNYHHQFPLSEHKSWVQEMMSIDWIEMAAHGHFHMTSDKNRFGECEMLELDTVRKCQERYFQMHQEWVESTDYKIPFPNGWKNPGWLCHPMWNDYIRASSKYDNFTVEYVSVHYEHNRNMQWPMKTFFGHDGIQQTDIRVHNVSEKCPMGMIMVTSHIAGDWNDNVWNEKNFEQLKLSLEYLTTNYNCEFKTLNECV